MPNEHTQALAKLILQKNDFSVTQDYKMGLLKYIINNEILFDNSENIHYKIFKIYLNYLILPPTHITSVLLSTCFHMNLNESIFKHSGVTAIDIYPFSLNEEKDEFFNLKNISKVQLLISDALQNRRLIRNRIASPLNTFGEVSWFDPFEKEISIHWGNKSYSVLDFESLTLNCQAAKKLFSNEEYCTFKNLAQEEK